MSWFRLLEPWLINLLLRSPSFHRFVQRTHKVIRRARHGPDPEDMGGTKIDKPEGFKTFLSHFKEELRSQTGHKRNTETGKNRVDQPPDSSSFLNHFREELREQFRRKGSQ